MGEGETEEISIRFDGSADGDQLRYDVNSELPLIVCFYSVDPDHAHVGCGIQYV